MIISADSQQEIDAYLKVLRKRLRGLSDQDSRDVVKEIRSHILDKAAVGEKSLRVLWPRYWTVLAAPKNWPVST
jgi:hypothetical protein